MPVFVDNVRIQKGRAFYCHMWADTLPELMAMANRLKLKKSWLQRPPRAKWVHFDLLLRQRSIALAYGAILTDQYGPAEHEARQLIASHEHEEMLRGRLMLERIENSRALHRLAKPLTAPPEAPAEPEQQELF